MTENGYAAFGKGANRGSKERWSRSKSQDKWERGWNSPRRAKACSVLLGRLQSRLGAGRLHELEAWPRVTLVEALTCSCIAVHISQILRSSKSGFWCAAMYLLVVPSKAMYTRLARVSLWVEKILPPWNEVIMAMTKACRTVSTEQTRQCSGMQSDSQH